MQAGAVIEARAKGDSQKNLIQASLDITSKRPETEWISLQVNQTDGVFKGTFERCPTRDELPSDFKIRESEVIQFYSK